MYTEEALKYLVFYSLDVIEENTRDNFLYKLKKNVDIDSFLEFLLESKRITKYAFDTFYALFPNRSYENLKSFIMENDSFDETLAESIMNFFVCLYFNSRAYKADDELLSLVAMEYIEMVSSFVDIYRVSHKNEFSYSVYYDESKSVISLNEKNVPYFYETYKIYIERETEDEDVVKVNDGVYLNKTTFEKADDLISKLDAIVQSEDASKVLVELKSILGF